MRKVRCADRRWLPDRCECGIGAWGVVVTSDRGAARQPVRSRGLAALPYPHWLSTFLARPVSLWITSTHLATRAHTTTMRTARIVIITLLACITLLPAALDAQ